MFIFLVHYPWEQVEATHCSILLRIVVIGIIQIAVSEKSISRESVDE